VEWLFKRINLAPPDDETAAGLHDYYSWSGRGVSIPASQLSLGDLCFYKNKSGQICHVSIAWGNGQVLEAGKGGPRCKTEADARRLGAEVMISLLNRHPNFFDAIRPVGLPWA
jgi:cell wall-associated NlpC family hydrolase